MEKGDTRFDEEALARAAEILRGARRAVAFTGAGISVESGIPPFRGPDGLWSRVDPSLLDIDRFRAAPGECWPLIRDLFYGHFRDARPNAAHEALARMERAGALAGVITQNIDDLHRRAGSRRVIELHGNSRQLVCPACGARFPAGEELLERLPPRCARCGDVLKPDFVFFGEPLPDGAMAAALAETREADAWLVVGTTGEIHPAGSLPDLACSHGARIVEVNLEPTRYTGTVTDVFLGGPAGTVVPALVAAIQS